MQGCHHFLINRWTWKEKKSKFKRDIEQKLRKKEDNIDIESDNEFKLSINKLLIE